MLDQLYCLASNKEIIGIHGYLVNIRYPVIIRYPVTIRYPVMIFFWLVSGELLSDSIQYLEKRYPAHP